MPHGDSSSRIQRVAVDSPTFGWLAASFMLLAAPAIGLLWARIGQVAQSYFARALLLPILVGVFVGLTVIGLVRLVRIGHRPTILTAALLAASVAAIGQHYFSYLSRYYWQPTPAIANVNAVDLAPSFRQYLSAQAAIGRPLPGGYRARAWAAWLTWSIDAVLVVAAAVAVTALAFRVPYCGRCGRWYRTVRNGKIDLRTADGLAQLLDIEPPDRPRSARFRLSACQAGCGPMRCELSWEHGGGVDLVQIWLDGPQRAEVAALLDGLPDDAETFDDE